jgi:phage gpG-like protein
MVAAKGGDIAKLATAAKRLRRGAQFEDAFVRIAAESMLAETVLCFRMQRDPYGTPWKPLKPATIAARRKGTRKGARSKGAQILVDTGILRNSLNSRILGPRRFAIGSPMKYAAAHQEGTATIPARPFLPSKGWPPKYFRRMVAAAKQAFAITFEL